MKRDRPVVPAPPNGPQETAQGANYALAVLIVAFAFSFLDRVILSMLMVPIQRDLGLTDVQLALLHGFAFVVFYALAGLPLGRLADTVSRKKLIACGILVWSLCTAACGLARGFVGLFLARVGVGVGEAALSPSAFSMLADYFPPARRARAIAKYQLGATIGAGIAYLFGGAVIGFAQSDRMLSMPGLGDLSPWRATFMLVGLPGILVALVALTMREPVRRETAPKAQKAGADRGSLIAWLKANRRTMACYALGFASINIAFNALIAWGPTWLSRVHGLEPMQVGTLMGAAMLLAGTTGQLLGARRSDKALARGRGAAVLETGTLCAILLAPLSLAMIAPALAIAMLVIAAMFFLACAAIGHAPSLIGQIAPNRLRGQVSAIFLFALNLIGAGLGPFLVAVLTDHVFADPRMIGASMAIVATAGALVGAVFLWMGRSALMGSIAKQTQSLSA